ncbi:MAG TPA: type II toxin-antitoxin system prevent-host-death family antitoxin [bacterium]|nr:type II toxin-antitoxin system prevent-host-death family antitoxin [bacterium]
MKKSDQTVVNTHEAKTNLSRLLEKVSKGKEVVIASAGRPIARLVPFKKPSPREPGLAKGTLPEAFFEPLPPDELKAWES